MDLRPCPSCRKPTAWTGNPHKPFCSERCRVRDLGAWSAGSYRIPDETGDDDGNFGRDPGEDEEGEMPDWAP